MSEDDGIPGMDSFVLRIALGNDAMKDERDVAEALRAAADKVESRGTPDYLGGSLILDGNGNTVGSWTFYLHAEEALRKELE
jgi:hypothetical protein